jgi:trans-aconitate methyltransferase
LLTPPVQERQRLDAIASDSRYASGVNAASVRYSVGIFERHFRPGSCLELGPAEGLATEHLARRFDDLTCVEGAREFCERLRGRHPRVKVHQALFEEYEPRRQFDNVVLGHVLEHVEQPRALLERVRGWLAPGGRVLAAVPNARSIHRQLAVLMGLLETEQALNDADRHHGHRRVYDPEGFRREFAGAGLRVEIFGGYWLKALSNAQIEKDWSAEMIAAAMVLGERHPEIAAEIYVVATA